MKRVQEIIYKALRKARKHVAAGEIGASMLGVILCEMVAATFTEMSVNAGTLRDHGDVERLVQAMVEPLEKMFRENAKQHFADEKRKGG